MFSNSFIDDIITGKAVNESSELQDYLTEYEESVTAGPIVYSSFVEDAINTLAEMEEMNFSIFKEEAIEQFHSFEESGDIVLYEQEEGAKKAHTFFERIKEWFIKIWKFVVKGFKDFLVIVEDVAKKDKAMFEKYKDVYKVVPKVTVKEFVYANDPKAQFIAACDKMTGYINKFIGVKPEDMKAKLEEVKDTDHTAEMYKMIIGEGGNRNNFIDKYKDKLFTTVKDHSFDVKQLHSHLTEKSLKDIKLEASDMLKDIKKANNKAIDETKKIQREVAKDDENRNVKISYGKFVTNLYQKQMKITNVIYGITKDALVKTYRQKKRAFMKAVMESKGVKQEATSFISQYKFV